MDPVNFRMRKVEMHEIGAENNKLVVYYNDYREVEGKWFPFNVQIQISANKDIDISVKYNKIHFGEKLSFPFHIPKKYQCAF
jgi:hypothetical protein